MIILYPTHVPYYIDYEVRSAQWSMPDLHRHETYEIYLVDKGRTNVIYDGDLFSAGRGNAVLFTPNSLHRACGGEEFSRWTVYFSRGYLLRYFTPAAVDSMLKCFERKFLELDRKQYDHVVSLMRELIQIRDTGSDSFILLGHVLFILNNLASAPPDKQICSNNVVGKALSFINYGFAKINSIDDVVNISYVTKEYLCTAFKKTTGMTITEYINSVRINHACDLLADDSRSITDISFECGYNSSTYFERVFKKATDKTPLEFRKYINGV